MRRIVVAHTDPDDLGAPQKGCWDGILSMVSSFKSGGKILRSLLMKDKHGEGFTWGNCL